MLSDFRMWIERDDAAPSYRPIRVIALAKSLRPAGNVRWTLGPYSFSDAGFDRMSRDVEARIGTTAAEWAVTEGEVLATRAAGW